MNFSRLLGIGFAMLVGIATAASGLAQYQTVAQVAPTAAPTLTPTPVPTPSSRPRRGRRAPGPASSGSPNPNASPTETPEPPQFDTLDGIWEVELQPMGTRLAKYAHFDIISTGAILTGYYQTGGAKGPKYPLTGTFDGRLISLTVTLPTGNASFNGYVETFADMVGLFKTSDKDPGMAFTAEHRKKMKT